MYINFINKVVIDTNAIYCINSYRDGQVHIIKYGSDIEFKNIDPLEFEMLLNKYNRDLIIGDDAIFLRLASGDDNSVLFHMKEIDYAYADKVRGKNELVINCYHMGIRRFPLDSEDDIILALNKIMHYKTNN